MLAVVYLRSHVAIGYNVAMRNTLQGLRRSARLTQAQVAASAHVSRVHISDIEAGKKKPSLDLFVALMVALNVPPERWSLVAQELVSDVITSAEAAP